MLCRRLMGAILAVLLLSGLAVGQKSSDNSTELKKVRTIEGISEYRLDNGLKVLLFPDPSKSTETVNMTVFVGSRHEGYGEAGMAHLLEHMLFKGTPDHPNVPKVLQDRGADFNGTTWVDRTNYYETLPSGGDNLEFALRLEADRLVNSSIKAEDLESEMTVVRNEFERGENIPAYVLSQKMLSAAYQWHNYGQATIGNRADIERVPIENLREFYEKYYQPDNTMVVVAGSFDPEKALQDIKKYFGAIPEPERELDQTYTQEPAQDGERVVTLRRVGDVSVVGAVYHIPAGPHPDYVAVDVLESVLTASPSGRLYKALVESNKAASISGAAFAWHDPGVIRLMAEVSEGVSPDAVLDTLVEVTEEVGEEGVSEEEVNRAKQRLLKQVELRASNSKDIAIELSEWAAQGDWRLYFLYRDRVEKVTPEDVKRVAAEYLHKNNRTVGLYLPTEESQRVPIPETPNLAEMIGDYKGREELALGEAFEVTPENIEGRTERVQLSEGIEAAFLEKETRGNSVNLRLTLRYGNEHNLKGLAKAAEFLPKLMTRGTKNLSRQEIQDLLDKHRANLSASGSAGEATFTIQTKREQLPAVLDVLRQILREPTLPEAELEILKRRQLATLEQRQNDPTALAVRHVSRQLNPYAPDDPRYVSTIAEEIERVKNLTQSDVQKLYEGYLGAQAGEVTVIGDFDSSEIKPILTETLTDWKASQPYERLSRNGDVKLEGQTEVILTPDKENATYFAGTVWPLSDAHPDYPALVIGNFILGGGSLSSRLGDRVRQNEGLSYGIGSHFQARSLDERAALSIYAITNPNNMGKVKRAIREEIERLLEKGITEKELKAAQQGYLQKQNVNWTEDPQLASVLEDTLYTDRTMEYYADLEKRINQLTPEQVVETLRKHIDLERWVIATAGDFPEKGTKAPESSSEKEKSTDGSR